MEETTYALAAPVSLAILADLHGKPYQRILERVGKRKPDMICLCGDVINGTPPEGGRSPLETQKNILPFLTACGEIAPTYFSLGNHEWVLDPQDLALIRDTGVTVLDNSWCVRGDLVIGGLTSDRVISSREHGMQPSHERRDLRRYFASPTGGDPSASPHRPDTSWLREYCAVPGYHILLCHHPEYYPLLPPGIDLVLSGHAHGGQWRYYSFSRHRWMGLFAPGQGFFPAFTSGVHDGRLVISRGLSNPISIPRICNPREIVYIDPL